MSLSFNFLFDDTHQPDSNNIVQLWDTHTLSLSANGRSTRKHVQNYVTMGDNKLFFPIFKNRSINKYRLAQYLMHSTTL